MYIYGGEPQNGGFPQQPLVFLLKYDHFGVWNGEDPPFKETPTYIYLGPGKATNIDPDHFTHQGTSLQKKYTPIKKVRPC